MGFSFFLRLCQQSLNWVPEKGHYREKDAAYEATCADGSRALANICAQLEIPEEGMLDTVASIFKTPSSPRGDKTEFDQKLRGRAEELHEALLVHTTSRKLKSLNNQLSL